MKTRNKSPFPTRECANGQDCIGGFTPEPNRFPESTGREYCKSCTDVHYRFGKHPDKIESVRIETFTREYPERWGYKTFVNGELFRESLFHSKWKRHNQLSRVKIAKSHLEE